jgi:hypothetical protein
MDLPSNIMVFADTTCSSWYVEPTGKLANILSLLRDYDWAELWRAAVGLLDFLSNKLDSLMTTGGVERLAQEVSTPRQCFLLLTRVPLDTGHA